MTATAPTRRPRPAAGLLLLAGLAGSGWWLWQLGTGPLAPPPLGRPAAWGPWVDRVGAVTAAFGVLRLLCLAATAYLVVCVLVGILARRSRRDGVRHAAELICLPPVRRLLEGLLGVGIGVGALTAAVGPVGVAGAAPATGRATATALAVGGVPTMRAVVTPPLMAAAPRMTMRVAGPTAVGTVAPTITLRSVPPPTASTVPPPTGATAAPPSAPPPDPAPEQPGVADPAPELPATPGPSPERPGAPAAGPTEFVVEAGDHFWRIAERTVTAAHGPDVGEDAVAAYWQRLVDANADRMSDPTNPDLLFTGQVLVLPAP